MGRRKGERNRIGWGGEGEWNKKGGIGKEEE